MVQLFEAKVEEENGKLFDLLSDYLNFTPTLIGKEEIDQLVASGVSVEYAFSVLLAAHFGLDIVNCREHKQVFNEYFPKMIHRLNVYEYKNNHFYKNIKVPMKRRGNVELKYEKFAPYEGFVFNDIIQTEEGRHIPQIGFFESEFEFPALFENGRIWMTITPNEIETMKDPIDLAFGHVLTFGLGLGYFTYMVSEKENVDHVTVVEVNEHVIDLFKTYILPQFKEREKITIIHGDAFEYAKNFIKPGAFDFVFTDLWHDISDGMEMYLEMKKVERQSPTTVFSYWIEKSILCYL